jgi:hypothetical protein
MDRRGFLRAGLPMATSPLWLPHVGHRERKDCERCLHAAAQPDPQNTGKFIPLIRGKIAIEIEFAERWFRRIEVKALG